jgi:SAM-dependent methyltransferase
MLHPLSALCFGDGMSGFDDPAFYGDRWAGVYDDHHGGLDPAPAVKFLAGLADGGRVLELAIGTGRVALPLAARGVSVEGVDASEAMVERLRVRPGTSRRLGWRRRLYCGITSWLPVRAW